MSPDQLSFIREELDVLLFEASVAERVFHTSASIEYLDEAMVEISHRAHAIRAEIAFIRERPKPSAFTSPLTLEELGL